MAGYECEEMAVDIKYNLRQQTDKLEKSTLMNLYDMQKDMIMGSRLLKLIAAERKKNSLVLYAVIGFLILAVVLILYFALF